MKPKHALLALAALFVFSLGAAISGGALYLFRELEATRAQTQLAEARAEELARQIATLKATAQLAQDRGREISVLQNRNAELEKELTGYKSKPADNQFTFTLGDAGNTIHFRGGIDLLGGADNIKILENAEPLNVQLPKITVGPNGVDFVGNRMTLTTEKKPIQQAQDRAAERVKLLIEQMAQPPEKATPPPAKKEDF